MTAPGRQQARRPAGHRRGPAARRAGGHRADRGEREHQLDRPGAVASSPPRCWSSRSSRCSSAAFTIFNTFSIIVGQRTRELALLRIVGASRRQVFRSVLAEAAITGLVSSVIGLGLGRAGRARAGGAAARVRHHAAPGSLVFEPRTVVVGPGRRRRRDRDRRDRPGPRRGAHPADRRARRPPVRARGVSLRRRFIGGAAAGPGRSGPAGHRAGQAGHRAGRRRRGRHLRRRRHAVPGHRPPAVQRDRPAAGPAARGTGQARPGELHAQPPAHRPDRRRRSWSAWPWSPRWRCSAPRCPGRPPAARTRRSAPTSS